MAGGLFGYRRIVRPKLELALALPPSPPAAATHAVRRIASWNLRNFRLRSESSLAAQRAKADLLRLRLEEHAADLWCFQEIADPRGLATLLCGDADTALARGQFWSSPGGGRHHQHLAFWIPNPERDQLVSAREHAELSLGGALRPAASAIYFSRSGDNPLRLGVMNVHLKAKRDGIDLRHEQWHRLTGLFSMPPYRDMAMRVVLGDFNVTGGPDYNADTELHKLSAEMNKFGFSRTDGRRVCSAYWQGRRFDAWKESSRLDLIFTSARNSPYGNSGYAVEPRKLRLEIGGMCRVHDCQPLYSSRTRPEPDYRVLSDHCPIFIDLPVFFAE